jgi:hypothetical protein
MDKQQMIWLAAIAAAVWYLWPYLFGTLRSAPAPFLPPPAFPPLPRAKKPTIDERMLAYQVTRTHLQGLDLPAEDVARLCDPRVPYLTRD